MYRFKDVSLRKFCFEDIPLKIEWINNAENNQYLHYDLPLEYEKTCKWFESLKHRSDRIDWTIIYNGRPVGLIGIINIDEKNKKGEDYIVVGDTRYRGKGIATKAGLLNMAYAFKEIGLNKLYGYIEAGNMNSVKQCQRRGGQVEGYLRADIIRNGKPVDNYVVGYYKDNFVIPEGMIWEE